MNNSAVENKCSEGHVQNLVCESCSILTTPPDELLKDVHDRMPGILHLNHYETWLTAPPSECSVFSFEWISRGNRTFNLLIKRPSPVS